MRSPSAAERHFARFRLAFLCTDLLMLFYWIVTAGVAIGLIGIPEEYLYSDYDNPVVVAWNWSFLLLDLLFCAAGLYAVALFQRGDPVWRDAAIISAISTSISGLMAISYWAIRREFDPSWWLPNLALLIWPIWFLKGLMRPQSAETARPA